MENVNQVTIAGHLVKSAELRYTTTGKPVAAFVVATNKRISEEKQIVSYIPVNAWNQAEELGALVKGDAVQDAKKAIKYLEWLVKELEK